MRREETERLVGCCVRTHGMAGTSEYEIWCGMLARCERITNRAYPQYGGRGIRVCGRWRSFEGFFADMGRRPPGRSLDRIDNDGDYSPENCRWATREEQNRNKRSNVIVTFRGRSMTLAEACQLAGNERYNLVRQRISRDGWEVERALYAPVLHSSIPGRSANAK